MAIFVLTETNDDNEHLCARNHTYAVFALHKQKL